jgi:hypothetical protein
MAAKLLLLLAAAIQLASAVTVIGYVGNFCNGEVIYQKKMFLNTCVTFSDATATSSIQVVGTIPKGQKVRFYTAKGCAEGTQVGKTTKDECYLQPPGTYVRSVGLHS